MTTNITRRDALALGVSAAALAATGASAQTASTIKAADVAAPKFAIEKGASLRMLRPVRFVQADEDVFRANCAKFTKETGVEVKVENGQIQLSAANADSIPLAGTTRAILANMVQGVAEGFTRKLELVGVGYRAAMQGKDLALSLGFSHPTVYVAPEGITLATPTQTEILVSGADKQRVGQIAAVQAFQKNRYERDREFERRVYERLRSACERFGYPAPEPEEADLQAVTD